VAERREKREPSILLVGQLPVLVKKGAEASHGAKNQPKERNNGSKTNHQRRI
jgi:hypothetical protein